MMWLLSWKSLFLLLFCSFRSSEGFQALLLSDFDSRRDGLQEIYIQEEREREEREERAREEHPAGSRFLFGFL